MSNSESNIIPPALVLNGISKKYGKIEAVHDLSLEVQPGQVVGLIGPDGAGKTTGMRITCGLLSPDTGTVSINGIDPHKKPRQAKNRLGYMPQRFSLYPDLSVEENLRFFADLYLVTRKQRFEREPRLMQFSRLSPFVKRRAQNLSGGMKQKLALMCTLIHNPSLLILDEPTTGVDPVSRKEFWTILKELASEGIALLISTPYMDEAEMCDRIILMHNGRVIGSGTPEEVASLFPHQLLEILSPDIPETYRTLKECGEDISIHRFGDRLHISCSDEDQIQRIRTILNQTDTHISSVEPTIEDTFVSMMKEAG